jgi:hypothetical protein
LAFELLWYVPCFGDPLALVPNQYRCANNDIDQRLKKKEHYGVLESEDFEKELRRK